MRTVVEWIVGHKIWSALGVVVLLIVIVFARKVADASSGELSEPIQRGSIIDAVYGIGTVTAEKRLSINPLIGNTVYKRFVREGDKVQKGKPLVTLSNGSTVNAPFDGVVNFSPYRPGENTFTTSPIIVFTDMTDRYIVVSMEQQGALRVKEGQTAKISFDSMRNKTFEGKVAAVYSYANNFLARIDSVELPDTVLPDMNCDIAIVIGQHDNALLIPTAAFVDGQVHVKRGHSIPRAVPVKLGINDGVAAEVLSGDVQPGDRLLIRKQVHSR